MPEKKTGAKTTRTTRTSSARATAAKPRAAAPRAAPRARKAADTKAVATPARPAPSARRSRRRTLVGVVVADRTPRTVSVEVTRLARHPLYKKVMRMRKAYPAHDAKEEARLGDLVRIEEGRPFSATKRFRLVEVLSRAGEARELAPQVAQVEAALEELEGVAELLPARKPADESAKEAEEQS